MPTAQDFQEELDRTFGKALKKGVSYVTVKAGDLHRQVGNYPGHDHRMPICCSVMRQNMQAGDVILHQPPKSNGATLEIRYTLPR